MGGNKLLTGSCWSKVPDTPPIVGGEEVSRDQSSVRMISVVGSMTVSGQRARS